ncbi:MAG TPA: DUF1631 family protein [Albitalea sp.]|nr:DUF1631 family protein [Albitalea sp.]
MNASDLRLPPALDAATSQVKATVQAVAERVASALGNQAQAATRNSERDLFLAAQIDLRRKMNTFLLVFGKELLDKVQSDAVPRRHSGPKATDWQSLTLVEDHEVEERMFSGRIGQQIAHACEWELREVAAYMGGLLNLGRAEEDRNPLRADVLGTALYRAIEAISDESDSRKLLAREFAQAMAAAMPQCYVAIVHLMQHHRVQPVGLTVKTVAGPGHGANTGYESMRDEMSSVRTQPSDFASSHGSSQAGRMTRAGAPTRPAPYTGSDPGAFIGGAAMASRIAAGVSAEAEAQLMSLLRRLTFLASRPGGIDIPLGTQPGAFATSSGGQGGITLPAGIGAMGGAAGGAGLSGLMAVNLIRAHRDELMQVSSGKLDHMVIDVVGSLFDQILSDPKVPPQMARQIARLQLPVLRVALVDATFFSSRRHPVRRFVNRIASLACAFDEFDEGPGKEFLDRIKSLVQGIVEGDFDQLDLYSAKLTELETFIAGQGQETVKSSGAATVLESKESELRVQQRYMMQLQSALSGVAMPDYLRDFVSQVWSQALVFAVRRDGVDSDRARRYRAVGRDLVMSVQPKGSPVMRKRFLMQLPTLMKDLNEGMKVIGWPEAAQKAFFAQLLPSHAESLKAPPMSELDHNLLVKELDGVFTARIPGAHEISSSEPVSAEPGEIEQRFSAAEAQQVGLLDESAVDWSGNVDIDLSGDAVDAGDTVPGDSADTVPSDLAPLSGLGIDINLDLATPDPSEPSHGPQLMEHLRVGFAYQMLLKDQWQKVRLNYVSPGRNFFVFTRGRKHQETISLTARMLARMCESNRLRAVEHAYLMERATARARRQLAALKVPSKAVATKH